MAVVSGTQATAHAAYALSDVSFVYSARQSGDNGVEVLRWAKDGEKNAFGIVGRAVELEIKPGAGGCVQREGSLFGGGESDVLRFSSSEKGLCLVVDGVTYSDFPPPMPGLLHVCCTQSRFLACQGSLPPLPVCDAASLV